MCGGGELALQKPVPKPVLVQVFWRYIIFLGGGVGGVGGWGEELVPQKPAPKPVLEQVFVVHVAFGVGGWVGGVFYLPQKNL